MEGEDDHDHEDFESFVVALGAQAKREDILSRIEQAIRDHDILRLKGFIALDGAEARLVVQAVGPRLSAYFDRPWQNGEARASSLVVIGEKGLNQAAIAAQLAG
jgi:cobalamin biosynthesis protein CobW